VHLLLVVDVAQEPAAFMRYFKSKLAREVNRLTGWHGHVFDRRYDMTVVTDEDAAQIERLRYVLSQAVKANLVERVCQWPGVHSAGALIDGTPLTGHWFDRIQEFVARLRRKDIGPMQFATAESITFSPIPCWAHLSPELYRARIASLVEAIETDAARRDPLYRPSTLWPGHQHHASTPPPRPQGRFSTRSTLPSSARSAKPPKGCSAATAMRPSLQVAFRRPRPSWLDSGRAKRSLTASPPA